MAHTKHRKFNSWPKKVAGFDVNAFEIRFGQVFFNLFRS
jgi:hypothetical protein